jgi:hypothetical protein
MDLSDFRRHLSAHGPDLSAWPDRDAAIDLLAVSDEAVALLAAAGAEDSIDPNLTDAIIAATRSDD